MRAYNEVKNIINHTKQISKQLMPRLAKYTIDHVILEARFRFNALNTHTFVLSCASKLRCMFMQLHINTEREKPSETEDAFLFLIHGRREHCLNL